MTIDPIIFFGLLAVTGFFVAASLYSQVRKQWAWYQERKRRALLRGSPHVLKNQIRELKRVVGHLEDETLKQRTLIDKLKDDKTNLAWEVRALNKRNQFMANEVRYDPVAETQVMRPVRAHRFSDPLIPDLEYEVDE